jgi:hypothetical protein
MFDSSVTVAPAFRTFGSGFGGPSFGLIDDGDGEFFEFGD